MHVTHTIGKRSKATPLSLMIVANHWFVTRQIVAGKQMDVEELAQTLIQAPVEGAEIRRVALVAPLLIAMKLQLIIRALWILAHAEPANIMQEDWIADQIHKPTLIIVMLPLLQLIGVTEIRIQLRIQ